MKLFIQAVSENKVNAVVAKVNGVFDNYILTENIPVLLKKRLSTVLVKQITHHKTVSPKVIQRPQSSNTTLFEDV